MEKKQFRLYDAYEEKELLVETNFMSDVVKAARTRDLDTDGEWYPLLKELDKETGKYKLFGEWTY